MNRVSALLVPLSLLVASVGVVAFAPTASATVDEPPRPAFYEAPATLPAANGTVIRSESQSFLLDPLDVSSLVANAKRVLYKTSNRIGEPIAVSGAVLVPTTSWNGPGNRPVIGYGVGVQGLGDDCAPSRRYAEGLEYEGPAIRGLLARGYAVALTDYEGLGTVGIHTFTDRLSQARALLDVVRAAQRLPGTGLSATSPVGLQGYSQGGGAAAAAAELAATYAPELAIKGVAAGAVPADLRAVATKVDASLFAGVGLFALRGLTASYGTDLTPYFNADGVRVLEEVEQSCFPLDLFDYAFLEMSDLTSDGKSMAQLVASAPFADMLQDQRIGTIRPKMPILVFHLVLDEGIPYAQSKAMATSWCNKGADVRFSTSLVPTHVGAYAPFAAEAAVFFEARFAGLPQASNCRSL